MLRRSFITGLVASCCLPALTFEKKDQRVISWRRDYDLYKQGTVYVAYVGLLYCAFILYQNDYTPQEIWLYYARPACMAIALELGWSDLDVENQRDVFLRMHNGRP